MTEGSTVRLLQRAALCVCYRRKQFNRMNKINYQRELDLLLKDLSVRPDGCGAPKLFLHSCCAPCSSYVLEYLSGYFEITDLYYNPNIEPENEYRRREDELKRLIAQMKPRYPIHFVSGRYDPKEYYDAVRGLEHIPEGGERCFACYRLRMEEAAKLAARGGFDYFTTTLSISPLKRADKINEIGQELAEKYGVKHLPSDFKKKGGYLRSVELSKQLGLYRQDYCGCIFSKKERQEGIRMTSPEKEEADQVNHNRKQVDRIG